MILSLPPSRSSTTPKPGAASASEARGARTMGPSGLRRRDAVALRRSGAGLPTLWRCSTIAAVRDRPLPCMQRGQSVSPPPPRGLRSMTAGGSDRQRERGMTGGPMAAGPEPGTGAGWWTATVEYAGPMAVRGDPPRPRRSPTGPWGPPDGRRRRRVPEAGRASRLMVLRHPDTSTRANRPTDRAVDLAASLQRQHRGAQLHQVHGPDGGRPRPPARAERSAVRRRAWWRSRRRSRCRG